jgi:M6 family metalloprotease-like protein
MRRRSALLATAIAVFLASGAASVGLPGSGGHAAKAQVTGSGEDVSSGIFTARYGDPWMNPEAGHELEYALTDGRGQETELLLGKEIAKQAEGTLVLIGKPVTVEGKITPDGGKIEVQHIRRERDGGVSTEGFEEFEADAAVAGHQPAATILCRFADSTGAPPHNRRWFETLVGDGVNPTKPGIDHFWHEVSFGNMDLRGSRVFGWYKLPEPRSSYFASTGNADLGKLANDCTQAADRAVSFPGYTTINLMFDRNLDGAAWGGWQPLTRDGQTKTYGVTWMPPWGYANQGVLAHEMGHSYGLPHSSGPYGATYDSWWDVMSSAGYLNGRLSGKPDCHRDITYGCVAMGTVSPHKDRVGWIPASQKYTAALGSSENMIIERLGTTATGNYLMAQIPINGSSTHFYTVESRRFVGYDDHVAGEAVVIHEVNTAFATGLTPIARVVDPDNNGNPNDASAMLLPGETFTDAANGIYVAVTGATASGYDLTINNSGSDTTAPRGTVVINAGAASTTRSVVRLTLSASDEGGSVEHARFSNDGANWSDWEPYATNKRWKLSPDYGKKTVYAQFRDGAGNVSDVARDTIVKKQRNR